MTRQSKSSMHCLDCQYCLEHLEKDECPECGRVFDASDQSTFRKYVKPLWPRWETVVAIVLSFMLYYFSWDWDTNYAFASLRSGGYRGLAKLLYLAWLTPSILLGPVFLISGLRSKPRSSATIGLSITSLFLYLACSGTHLWYGNIIQVIHYSFGTESYWEAMRRLLP